jgi:hypothetical protein
LSYNASHRESKGTGKSFPVFVDEMTLSGPPVSYSDSPRRSRFFYGWWIAISAAIMHFFGGGTFYYGFTVFFNPIRESFGWNATVTSVAFTLQRLEGGIMGPIAGYMVDRFGPRRLMMAGWVVVGVGFILMSRISSLWGFYGTFVIIATGSSFASGMMSNVAIANWFNKKRSRALTTAFIGPGLCGLLVPVLASLNNRFGWQHTLFLIGIGLWLTVLPLSLVMRHRPVRLPSGWRHHTGTTVGRESNGPAINQRATGQVGAAHLQLLVPSLRGFLPTDRNQRRDGPYRSLPRKRQRTDDDRGSRRNRHDIVQSYRTDRLRHARRLRQQAVPDRGIAGTPSRGALCLFHDIG